jgi:hypothetical protein
MKLLEVNKKTAVLSFLKEIENLEFTEIIGEMDIYSCLNLKNGMKYWQKSAKDCLKNILNTKR